MRVVNTVLSTITAKEKSAKNKTDLPKIHTDKSLRGRDKPLTITAKRFHLVRNNGISFFLKQTLHINFKKNSVTHKDNAILYFKPYSNL